MMQHFVLWLVTDLLAYPVRDAHPLVALAYFVALIGGVLLACFLIAAIIPDPWR
jgi:hypothetical protein